MKTRTALPWFGSDASLSAELASYLDACDHVTIVQVGGAGILQHIKAKGIVANDLHRRAVDFYLVASGQLGGASQRELVDRCKRTLSHPAAIDAAVALREGADIVDRAWSLWAECWIGRKGKGGTKSQGGKPSVRRRANGGNNATRIVSAADDLQDWAAHFKRCEWTCEGFRECLDKVADDPTCGMYLDAPWVSAGKSYLHSYTEQDHRDQADCLRRFEQSPILVRYGDEALIHELYPVSDGWHWHSVESRTQAGTAIPEVWISKRCEVE